MKGNSLKKIVLLIWCLLGVVCAWASPFYRGAQVPAATMTSTSSMMRSSYRQPDMSTNNRVQGFRTSASYVTGGVTSSQTFNRHGALRRGSTPGLGGGEGDPPGDPDCPNCIWVDDVCIICGHDKYDGCTCGGDGSDCHCPVEFDWKALLFLTAAAGVYMAKKTKKSRAYEVTPKSWTDY